MKPNGPHPKLRKRLTKTSKEEKPKLVETSSSVKIKPKEISWTNIVKEAKLEEPKPQPKPAVLKRSQKQKLNN